MDEKTETHGDSPWLPFETRRRARDEKREAILRIAMQLFYEQGYHNTSLKEIAERLNITKAALYNYFQSKDDILFEGWSLGVERIDESIVKIEQMGGSGLDKLRELTNAYALLMTTVYGSTMAWFQLHDLPDARKQIVRDAKKRIDLVFRRYIVDGTKDGSIKACDATLTTFAIAGSLNWIPQWYKQSGTVSREAMAAAFTAHLTDGLAKRPNARKPPAR